MVNTRSRMFTLTRKHPSILQKSTIILHLKIVSTNFLEIFCSKAKTKQSEKECTLYLKYASVMIALVYNEYYIFLLKLHLYNEVEYTLPFLFNPLLTFLNKEYP